MVLLGFLLGFLLLGYGLRRRSDGVRGSIIIGYNYLFVTALCFAFQFTSGMTAQELARTLVLSLYQAPLILSFQMDLSSFSQFQLICIFFLSAIYTVRTVLLVVFRRTFNNLALKWRIRRRQEVYVVIGPLPDAKALIADLRKSLHRAAILYLLPDREEDDADLMDGVLTVSWDSFVRFSPAKEYYMVLLPGENHQNLDLLRQLEQLGQRMPHLHVTAFLDNSLLRLEDLRLEHMDAWLVSREQLLVRRYLNGHLPLVYLKEHGLGREESGVFVPDAPFSLCVIGFGPLCREFLLSTYENTAFETAAPGGRGLDALILSEHLSRHQGAFFRDFPQMALEPGFTWLEAGAESAALFDAVEQRLGSFQQFFIDTGNTAANIDTAQRLLRLYRRRGLGKALPQFVVVLHEDAPGSMALFSELKNVSFLQANHTQYTYEELILRETDRQAQALHRQYQGENTDAPAWQSLGTFTQTSNRAVIWDIPNKQALAGDLSRLTPEQRDAVCWRIAQYEHRRWNAFHFSRGWTRLPLEELTEEELAQCKTKHLEERRHICLVDWDELDALPQTSPGILKYYDYENVTALFTPKQQA